MRAAYKFGFRRKTLFLWNRLRKAKVYSKVYLALDDIAAQLQNLNQIELAMRL